MSPYQNHGTPPQYASSLTCLTLSWAEVWCSEGWVSNYSLRQVSVVVWLCWFLQGLGVILHYCSCIRAVSMWSPMILWCVVWCFKNKLFWDGLWPPVTIWSKVTWGETCPGLSLFAFYSWEAVAMGSLQTPFLSFPYTFWGSWSISVKALGAFLLTPEPKWKNRLLPLCDFFPKGDPGHGSKILTAV